MRTIISLRILCLLMFAVVLLHKSMAQALSLEDIKVQMIKDWERAKAYTIEYLNTMPAEKYTFKATDSTRSFAGHMLHLAQADVRYFSLATGGEPLSWVKSDPQHRLTAEKKDSVMYYVNASYDYCIAAIKKF
jgi:hypothetical protein